MNCNFPILDDPIRFSMDIPNVLIVEDVSIYSKIIYSLYQRDSGVQPDYSFIIFDDDFNQLSNFVTILNPLFFDFNTPTMKKILFTHIISRLDIDEIQEVEGLYNRIYQFISQFALENMEVELSISDTYKLDDILKMLKVSILDATSSVFERTQLILNVLHNFHQKGLIIFCGLGILLNENEYNLIIETARMNQQRVIFIENQEIDNLKGVKKIKVDKDYFCTEKML